MRHLGAPLLLCTAGVWAACGDSDSSGLSPDGGAGSSGSSGSGGSSGAGGADASTTTCDSDKDCRALEMLCDVAAHRCVSCLFDTNCAEGERCVEGACTRSLTCENSLDCVDQPGGRSVCDPVLLECVECVLGADCPENHDCIARECVEYTPCETSLDCPPMQVCNEATSRCVQCVGDNDCQEGQRCVAATCREGCVSDKDCTPLGMLCDAAGGYCVECRGHLDCAEQEYCAATVCEADECVAGSSQCQGNAITVCLPDGEGLGSAVPCVGTDVCVQAGSTAQCQPDAGTGGAGGTGGSGGTGGGPDVLLIDNLEDGNDSILPSAGRRGHWFTFNDGTLNGFQTPEPGTLLVPDVVVPARGTSTRAAHTTGGGFVGWGAGMALDFVNEGTPGAWGLPVPHDISQYSGVRFFAKGNIEVRVEVTTSATTLVAEGGTCSLSCNDHHGTFVSLSSVWTEHSVSFSTLTQRSFGTPTTFNPATALTIQFLVLGSLSFDVWIDDIRFF